jgi:tellurite methyltransferase
MTLSDVGPDAFLQVLDTSRYQGLSSKQHAMDIFGTITPGPTNDNIIAVFIPFENGAWADAELFAHIRRDRYLPLGRNSGSRDCHILLHYHGNGCECVVSPHRSKRKTEATIVSVILEQFGPIDIYLFDQLLRGRITCGMRILDAGCGGGRNLVYLLRTAHDENYQIFAADSDPQAIAEVRRLAASLAPQISPQNFHLETIEKMSFPDAFADVVLSSAVLHFASNDDQFQAMLRGTWRVLKPGGLFFCRLASSIGIKDQITPISGRRYLLPDGSERYLVDEPLLNSLTEQFGATLADPLKTTVVQNQRSMTTWVLRKNRKM